MALVVGSKRSAARVVEEGKTLEEDARGPEENSARLETEEGKRVRKGEDETQTQLGGEGGARGGGGEADAKSFEAPVDAGVDQGVGDLNGRT
eukprot:461125-Rhodomonas_salina.2